MQPLISVVIPIYNVEKYLDRCINSVVNQTYKNLEIILVDDGSPDNCPQMCDDWSRKDSRIKVIHKKNAGLGMARNTGIDNANGEYICFFDSDDYVALTTVEKAFLSISKYNSDLVLYGMNSVDGRGNVVSSDIPTTDKDFYKDDEIANFILPNMLAFDPSTGKKLGFNMSSSGCMYTMKLIEENNWRFVSEREYISEDFYSLLKLYRYVKSVSIIHEALYFYCYNSSSLTHQFDSNRFKRICICHQGMVQIYNESKYPIVVKNGIDSQFFGSVIASMKQLINSDLPNKEKKSEIDNIIHDHYLQKVLSTMDISNESFQRKIIINQVKRKNLLSTYTLVKLKS